MSLLANLWGQWLSRSFALPKCTQTGFTNIILANTLSLATTDPITFQLRLPLCHFFLWTWSSGGIDNYVCCAILVYIAKNIRLYREPSKRTPETATPKIPRGLLALAKEARKYKSAEEFAGTLGISAEDIVWMKAFGSSVEGNTTWKVILLMA